MGLALLVASAGAFYWFISNSRFDLDPEKVQVSELLYTQPDLIRTTIDLPVDATPNVFRIDTGRMERALAALPAVAQANVSVALPDRLDIEITERTPTFVLVTPAGAFVVDVDGYVLDELPDDEAHSLGLPVVTDLRQEFAIDFVVGEQVDSVSLDADLRLAAITPTVIGTRFSSLTVTADDAVGYVISAVPGGWRAIFGHYTPNLRPVDIIDRQVQCLRARVAAGEDDIAVIYLAPLEDRCGTYLPRSTPASSPSPT